MVKSRSATSTKKKAAKQEAVTKTPKREKDACPKEAKSKRGKTGKPLKVNTAEHENRSTTRRKRSSNAEPTAAGKLTCSVGKKTCFSAWGWNFYLIVILCRWTEAKQEGDQTERQVREGKEGKRKKKKKKGGGEKPLYKAAFILLDVF